MNKQLKQKQRNNYEILKKTFLKSFGKCDKIHSGTKCEGFLLTYLKEILPKEEYESNTNHYYFLKNRQRN